MVSPFASRDRGLRASDQDRERLALALKDHAADGRLSVEELDERLDTCYSARTVGELESLLWDLPTARSSPPATVARPRPPRSPLRTALVVLGVVLALLVLPQLLVGAIGLAFAAGVIAVGLVFMLVPLALVVGVIYLVVRAIRAADAR
jgi:hypothetical protein